MIITQISVSYGETQSLPDYCNSALEDHGLPARYSEE
jgi:hypothetical protein